MLAAAAAARGPGSIGGCRTLRDLIQMGRWDLSGRPYRDPGFEWSPVRPILGHHPMKGQSELRGHPVKPVER